MNEFVNKIAWFLLGVVATVVICGIYVKQHVVIDGDRLIVNDSIAITAKSVTDTIDAADGDVVETVSVEDNIISEEMVRQILNMAVRPEMDTSRYDVDRVINILTEVVTPITNDLFDRLYTDEQKSLIARLYASTNFSKMTEEILAFSKEIETRFRNDTVLFAQLESCRKPKRVEETETTTATDVTTATTTAVTTTATTTETTTEFNSVDPEVLQMIDDLDHK